MSLQESNTQDIETAIEMKKGWLEAEKTVMTGQSYSIGGNTVTRADLSKIRESIEYWDKKLKSLTGQRKKRRIYGVIIRDL